MPWLAARLLTLLRAATLMFLHRNHLRRILQKQVLKTVLRGSLRPSHFTWIHLYNTKQSYIITENRLAKARRSPKVAKPCYNITVDEVILLQQLG